MFYIKSFCIDYTCSIFFVDLRFKSLINFLECKKHSSTGYNRLIHLAIHHKALKEFIPESHWGQIVYRKKKEILGGSQSSPKRQKVFDPKEITSHLALCKAKFKKLNSRQMNLKVTNETISCFFLQSYHNIEKLILKIFLSLLTNFL